MKKFFKDIKNDRITRLGFVIALLLAVCIFVFTLFKYRGLPPFIPLFNQLPWGSQRLGETPTIFIPLAVVFFIFATNLIIASFVYQKMPLVARILASTSLVVSLLTILFIVKTINLVL